MHYFRGLALLMLMLSGFGCALWRPSGPFEARWIATVQPILERRCVACHGKDLNLQAGLDLRSLDTILTGGSSGPAVIPGDARQSLLLQMIQDGEMPPEGDAVSSTELEAIRYWIQSTQREGEQDVGNESP